MATQADDDNVKQSAAELKDTPYELLYISVPTPTSKRYVFQHAVATSPGEALALIATAKETLTAGKGEWTSGRPYPDPQ